jgi:hypothetical protein
MSILSELHEFVKIIEQKQIQRAIKWRGKRKQFEKVFITDEPLKDYEIMGINIQPTGAVHERPS